MRGQLKGKGIFDLEPKNRQIQEFYDPFKTTKPISSTTPPVSTACVTLFESADELEDDEEDFIVRAPSRPAQKETAERQVFKEDPFLKKILENSRAPPRQRRRANFQQPSYSENQPFCFNRSIFIKYPQTPQFKNHLQSPFCKFNANHKMHMENLKQKTVKVELNPIDLNSDPYKYVSAPLNYFIGMSLKLKQKQCTNASRALLKLGCYVEPRNQKAWKKYIDNQEQYGHIYKAFILSKTAFLFTQNEQFAKLYLAYGQKCGVALGQMRGILNSCTNPDIFERGVLIEIGKMVLKHQHIWKGEKILFQICQWNDFRLPVCGLIIFLAKYLENQGERQKGISILKRSFGRGMSKLQVYSTYFEMQIREQNGLLKESLIKQVLEYIDCISSENRYRLYLQIGEQLFKRNDSNYQYYIEQAFAQAKKHCAPGSGCNKTIRNIYYTVLRWKNLPPPPALPSDSANLEVNRYEYITKGNLQHFQFNDWKYYLHYGAIRNIKVLEEASKKWNYTGRLIAEWIHALRNTLSPREVLKIWRQKVDQVPKSGQLWCQGGRIYAQLREYDNASKCFKAAMHFTPQFGDSFIEQLRLYLMKGQFLQAHKLKKITFVCEPFYGHVWSFLRESNPGNAKLSLSDMWDLATQDINNSLYAQNLWLSKPADKDYRLLTAYAPYNQAYMNPNTPEIRKKLFASYEQLDSKN